MDCSPWDSPGKNTGVGCHFLPQRIFLSRGSNPCLLLGRQMLLPPSCLQSPLQDQDTRDVMASGGEPLPAALKLLTQVPEGPASRGRERKSGHTPPGIQASLSGPRVHTHLGAHTGQSYWDLIWRGAAVLRNTQTPQSYDSSGTGLSEPRSPLPSCCETKQKVAATIYQVNTAL